MKLEEVENQIKLLIIKRDALRQEKKKIKQKAHDAKSLKYKNRNEEIYGKWKAGEKRKEIATEFGISYGRVVQICRAVERKIKWADHFKKQLKD